MNKNSEASKFLFIPEDFIFFDEKILINKSELSKAMNAAFHSGDPSFVFVPRSYDKEDRKYEDDVVSDMNKWIRDRELNLRDELKQFYADLNR